MGNVQNPSYPWSPSNFGSCHYTGMHLWIQHIRIILLYIHSQADKQGHVDILVEQQLYFILSNIFIGNIEDAKTIISKHAM